MTLEPLISPGYRVLTAASSQAAPLSVEKNRWAAVRQDATSAASITASARMIFRIFGMPPPGPVQPSPSEPAGPFGAGSPLSRGMRPSTLSRSPETTIRSPGSRVSSPPG